MRSRPNLVPKPLCVTLAQFCCRVAGSVPLTVHAMEQPRSTQQIQRWCKLANLCSGNFNLPNAAQALGSLLVDRTYKVVDVRIFPNCQDLAGIWLLRSSAEAVHKPMQQWLIGRSVAGSPPKQDAVQVASVAFCPESVRHHSHRQYGKSNLQAPTLQLTHLTGVV